MEKEIGKLSVGVAELGSGLVDTGAFARQNASSSFTSTGKAVFSNRPNYSRYQGDPTG